MKIVYLVFLSMSVYGENDSIAYGESRKYYNETRPKGIVSPCPDFNLACIRRFFAQYSGCTPAFGPAPDPYPVPRLEMPIPSANMTFIWNNAQVKGLSDAKINEFYVNTATNKLVLEIGLEAISIFSPGSIARYHIKGREPVELTDYSFITYRMVSLTVTAPFDSANGIQMSKPLVYAHMGDSRGYANIGRKLVSTEPELLRAYNLMLDNIVTSMREAFIVQGPLHFSEYLESCICSFENKRILS